MPYPDGFTMARYDAAQGRDDDGRAELAFLDQSIDKHAWALIEALRSVELRDMALTDMCNDAAEALETALTAIKRRGDF